MGNSKFNFISIAIFVLGCFSHPHKDPVFNRTERGALNDIKTVASGNYRAELITTLSKDTLIGEWEDDIYGSPIVEHQKIIFYEDGNIIGSHTFPVSKTSKSTKYSKSVEVPILAILDICLIDLKGDDLYYVYGAGFCNGVGCPEFVGVYKMTGEVLNETITATGSVAGKISSLVEIERMYDISLDDDKNCETILSYWLKQ
jgi:hypothetical protein